MLLDDHHRLDFPGDPASKESTSDFQLDDAQKSEICEIGLTLKSLSQGMQFVVVRRISLLKICSDHVQGISKRRTPGCVKYGEKMVFVYLLQAGERNFLILFSHNLGPIF